MRYSGGASAKTFLVGMLFAASCLAQQNTSADPADTAAASPLPVLIAPRLRATELRPNAETNALLQSDKEGWVTLQMMIDPKGLPYEVAVTGSSGDDSFRKEALRTVRTMAFEPARYGDETVTSAYELKLKFSLSDREKAARAEFVGVYKALQKAVAAGDRTLADTLMAKLKPDNLYEDAYFGVASFQYAEKWGTAAQQILALERAVAGETKATYLPRPLFEGVLTALFRLEAKTNRFGSALITLGTLKKLPADPKTLASLQPIADQIQALHSRDVPIGVAGAIGATAWRHALFRNHFQLQDIQGKVAELKLRCERQYVAFPFDPSLQYTVSDKSGACWLEVVGDVGTTFTLVET